jgi:hypothetical protein
MASQPLRRLVDEILVSQDIGSYEAVYKVGILQFWSDGQISWRPRKPEEFPRDWNPINVQMPRYIGDPTFEEWREAEASKRIG